MTTQMLLEKTVAELQKLPVTKLQEVADFIEFLLAKDEDRRIAEGIQALASESSSFDFLCEEDDLYTVNDLKHRYK